MEKITAQEALHRLTERYKVKIMNGERKKLAGLDINDYVSVFRRGSEVTILEYCQVDDTLAGTLMKHKQEIFEQIDGATDIILLIIVAKGIVLMLEDINMLESFVNLLGEDANFYWGMENEDTIDFKVKMEVYIIK